MGRWVRQRGRQHQAHDPQQIAAAYEIAQHPLEGLLLGAALYLVVDPLSPNWQIEESRIAEDRFRIALRRKLFASGGDGEASQVFQRRADQIALDAAMPGIRYSSSPRV